MDLGLQGTRAYRGSEVRETQAYGGPKLMGTRAYGGPRLTGDLGLRETQPMGLTRDHLGTMFFLEM